MAALDFSSLKSYVSGGAPRAVGAGVVLLDVQHSNLNKSRFVEIPFDLFAPISTIKAKVYQLTGTRVDDQLLYLNGKPGEGGISLSSDSSNLAAFGASPGLSGQWLYVVDNDPYSLSRSGGLDDESRVKKYVMSDADYNKREGTYRAFKNKMKQEDPNWQSIFTKGKTKKQPATEGAEKEIVDSYAGNAEIRQRIRVGDRCLIEPGARRGKVAYVGFIKQLSPHPLPLPTQTDSSKSENPTDQGKTETTAGETSSASVSDGSSVSPAPTSSVEYPLWIGVSFDEPVGNHDGVVGGVRYFDAGGPRRGTVVRPNKVTVGDFPEIDPFADLDDEDEDDENDQEKVEAESHEGQEEPRGAGQSKTAAPDLYEEL